VTLKLTTLFCEVIMRNEIPTILKFSLLIVLLFIATISILNPKWFLQIKLLTLIPIQKFQWKSEKYNGNFQFRIASFFTSTLIFSITIFSYLPMYFSQFKFRSTLLFFGIYGSLIGLFILKLVLDHTYFWLHKDKQSVLLITDYQYGLNQSFAFLIGGITLIDVYYFRLSSPLITIVFIIFILYLIARIFGTFKILLSNFQYPIFSVIVYLCTFEIVSIMVFVKILIEFF